MEEDKEFQIKILTEIMKKQQELINNIFNIIEKYYIKKSKFEEDEAVIEEMAKWLYEDDTSFGYGKLKEVNTQEKIKEYFRNKVKEKKTY